MLWEFSLLVQPLRRMNEEMRFYILKFVKADLTISIIIYNLLFNISVQVVNIQTLATAH